jgi:hypothetical protein
MRAVLSEKPAVDAVFGKVRLRFEPGAPYVAEFSRMDGSFLRTGTVGCGLFRNGLLKRIGGFAEDMQFGEDADYHLRLTEAGMRSELCEIDSLVYRRHTGNATNALPAARAGFFEMLRRKVARGRSRADTS